jgi:cleavage stimulation factor subunit 3
MNTIAGGIFSLPMAVTDLVKRLPPPHTFEGPFVIIDELINIFQESEFSDEFQPNYVYINGEPIREFEHLGGSVSAPVASAQQISTSLKRQLPGSGINNSNSDDEDSKKAKLMDIYKERQYKKLLLKK